MEPGLLHYVLAAIAAYVGEMFGSIFGGGSFVIQPALLALGTPPRVAVANDVAAAAFSTLFFFLAVSRRQVINKDAAVWMGPAMIAGIYLGGLVLTHIPESAVGWIVLAICCAGLLHTLYHLKYPAPDGDIGGKPLRHWRAPAFLMALALGVYDGISGAGSGILFILCVGFLFRRNMKATLATASALSVLAEGAAALNFWRLGLLDGKLLLVMIPACSLAGLTGAKIVHSVPEKALRIAFACVISALIAYLAAARF